MQQNIDEITINGQKYYSQPKNIEAKKLDGMPYVIVRTYSAGVFACYLEKREGKEALLRNARRIWYWEGAASISQLAVDGSVMPDKCKFAMPVDKIEVTEVIEVDYCTEKARECIQGVPVWKK